MSEPNFHNLIVTVENKDVFKGHTDYSNELQ